MFIGSTIKFHIKTFFYPKNYYIIFYKNKSCAQIQKLERWIYKVTQNYIFLIGQFNTKLVYLTI